MSADNPAHGRRSTCRRTRNDPAALMELKAAGPCADRSGREQPLEERAVALEGGAQVVGVDVLAAIPLTLQLEALVRERLRQVLHELGGQAVGLLDRAPRLVHEPGLHVRPAG